jgi:hypothetical protein
MGRGISGRLVQIRNVGGTSAPLPTMLACIRSDLDLRCNVTGARFWRPNDANRLNTDKFSNSDRPSLAGGLGTNVERPCAQHTRVPATTWLNSIASGVYTKGARQLNLCVRHIVEYAGSNQVFAIRILRLNPDSNGSDAQLKLTCGRWRLSRP